MPPLRGQMAVRWPRGSVVIAYTLVGSEVQRFQRAEDEIRSEQRLIDPGVNGRDVAAGDGGKS